MRKTSSFRRVSTRSVLALSLLAAATLPTQAADVQLSSETIFRYFERDTAKGDGRKVLPAYQYLRLDLGQFEDKGLSFHAYGWGRYDLASSDYLGDDAQGEVLYGYLQYSHLANNLTLRLGRQHVFEGVANESVDGVRVSADVTDYFSASVYGGQPVALEEVDGRSGDRIWGGRLGHHLGRLYAVGLSYKRMDNDGDRQEEALGVDTSLNLGTRASLYGTSVRNLVADVWQEHSYLVRLPVYRFEVRPLFERFDYAGYFDTGANGGSPFLWLRDSRERVTVLGGDVSWRATGALELIGRAKHYNYAEGSDNAWYYAALASWRGGKGSQVGAELGRMNGGTEATAYTQVRGYLYRTAGAKFMSADLLYVRYDADIYGENRSLFASAGGGLRFLDDRLEVAVSGDCSVDPYFDRDLRGMLNVKYLFEL